MSRLTPRVHWPAKRPEDPDRALSCTSSTDCVCSPRWPRGSVRCGCGQESAGLDLLPQEHRWKWLVVLLPREREIELRGCLDLQLSVRRWQDWCILASPGIQLPEELGEQE